MYLTGDYVNLVDYGKDYLDKPHLHFWLAAFSYKIFGVNTFAYKLPSLLFTIMGTYSTYRLGRYIRRAILAWWAESLSINGTNKPVIYTMPNREKRKI